MKFLLFHGDNDDNDHSDDDDDDDDDDDGRYAVSVKAEESGGCLAVQINILPFLFFFNKF